MAPLPSIIHHFSMFSQDLKEFDVGDGGGKGLSKTVEWMITEDFIYEVENFQQFGIHPALHSGL